MKFYGSTCSVARRILKRVSVEGLGGVSACGRLVVCDNVSDEKITGAAGDGRVAPLVYFESTREVEVAEKLRHNKAAICTCGHLSDVCLRQPLPVIDTQHSCGHIVVEVCDRSCLFQDPIAVDGQYIIYVFKVLKDFHEKTHLAHPQPSLGQAYNQVSLKKRGEDASPLLFFPLPLIASR